MVMLMRTLLFPVDNGMGTGLTGNGLAAEYDLWTGKVTWRQATKQTIEKQQALTSNLLIIASCLSPVTVAGMILLSRSFPIFEEDLSEKIDIYAPIILGIVLFLAFEALMLAIRVRDPLAQEEPDLKRQYDYFEKMFDFAIRKNISGDSVKTPYLASYLSVAVALLCIPLSYYVYLNPEQFPDSDYGNLSILLATSVFISLVPNFLWNLIIKQLIYVKLIRKTKEKILKNES
ncbi:TPA: hypothetical protein TVG17_000817 [Streptococcus equi subsp. zooepidemicus]|uniref:hypothetical protein n=1 Tax=Streptococcus equi TaxID=1336 RepID=UPI0012B02E47|nr:hypothetical protein [Streptococcus equi]MCD3413336.1 hypothetical protein [Streptococcus equi subsp. zooepidemicus]QGM23687.1 hypothetical protein GJS33_05940 [Streptococcus equi subsp. zooepidemicus]HEL0783054.1 hypothetical protein [Streptococcus equi subsp. zooepidemicus]HEL0786393.1 hypothetical protein [Streptococcus equi subsp. zooepidemicus]HEL0800605.1 hypothetical protein [Streptococcus equi subsp. zooepidemicus]